MDFFEKTGRMAIGSRLRMLTDLITADAAQIYNMYGVPIRPKWFPLFFVLTDSRPKTITGIAKEIGHSHPSVSNIVKEMSEKGLIKESTDKEDKRRTLITLSRKGRQIAALLKEQCTDVSAAIDGIFSETRHDLWKAISEWEDLLNEKSLLQRVKESRKARESREVKVVAYEPEYHSAFRSLNEEWITAHWQLEEHDIEVLDHPKEQILDRGGYIFVGCYHDEPLGVCALCKMDDPVYDYELAKLAVSPHAQGKGIGLALCRTAIEKAREQGAKKLFLESNTLLKPAIHLYQKLGFRELAEYHPAYARGDIQMELDIQP